MHESHSSYLRSRREKPSTDLHSAREKGGEGGAGPVRRFRSMLWAIASLKATRSTDRQLNLLSATNCTLLIELEAPLGHRIRRTHYTVDLFILEPIGHCQNMSWHYSTYFTAFLAKLHEHARSYIQYHIPEHFRYFTSYREKRRVGNFIQRLVCLLSLCPESMNGCRIGPLMED